MNTENRCICVKGLALVRGAHLVQYTQCTYISDKFSEVYVPKCRYNVKRYGGTNFMYD